MERKHERARLQPCTGGVTGHSSTEYRTDSRALPPQYQLGPSRFDPSATPMASLSARTLPCLGFKSSDSVTASARGLLAEDVGMSMPSWLHRSSPRSLWTCLPAQSLGIGCGDSLRPFHAMPHCRLGSAFPQQRRNARLAGRCTCSVGGFGTENEGKGGEGVSWAPDV